MLDLKLLGGLMVTAGSGPPLHLPRRRQALLALLGASHERGCTRERLVGYLWPDVPEERGRHSLEQLLSTMRGQFGDELFDGTDPMRLRTSAVTTDVADFEAALRAGDRRAAVARYAGPFVDGFYLNDADEFARWCESERARLQGLYVRALEQMADDDSARGEHGSAVQWWRMIVAVDPLAARSTVALMRALAAAGDRPAALRHAQVHEALVREELELAADPTVAQLASELRETGDPFPSRRVPLPQTPPAVPSAADDGPATERDSPEAPSADTSAPAPRRHASARRVPLLSALLLIATGAFLWLGYAWSRTPRPPALPRLAVLPYRVLGEPRDDPFADGLSDEIANRIARIPGVTLIGRQSVLSYRNTSKPATEIGAELHVDYVLSGTVQWSGGQGVTRRMRVLSELQRTSDNAVVWSRPDEVELTTDVFRMQDDIAERVLIALSVSPTVALAHHRQTPPTRDPVSYTEYLIGRRQASLRTGTSLENAISHFERAIDHDSLFADAWAAAANAWGVYPNYWSRMDSAQNLVPSADRAFEQAKAHAARALELDPESVEARLALAYVRFLSTADHERGIRDLSAIVDVDPANPFARHFLRHALVAAGRYREALAQSRIAVELDPLSPLGNTIFGVDLVANGDTSAALVALRRAIEVNENFSQAFMILGALQLARGQRAAGADSIRLFLVRRGYPPATATLVASSLASGRQTTRSLEAMESLIRSEWEPEPRHAGILALLGARERAVELLELARARHVAELTFQRHQPFFAPLRGMPRFEAIWAKNGW